MFGGFDDVCQLSRRLRRFANVPDSVIDGSTSSYVWSMRPVIGNDWSLSSRVVWYEPCVSQRHGPCVNSTAAPPFWIVFLFANVFDWTRSSVVNPPVVESNANVRASELLCVNAGLYVSCICQPVTSGSV